MSRRHNSRTHRNRRGGQSRFFKRSALVVLTVVGVLLAALIVGWFQLLAHLQSESFRHTLCRKMQEATGAEQVSMDSNLRIHGETVAQRKLCINGMGAIENLSVERLSATVRRRALLERKLHIRKLTMEEGHISFRSGAALAAPGTEATDFPKKDSSTVTPQVEQPTDSATSQASAALSTSRDSGFSLRALELDFAECKDTNLNLHHGDKTYSLTGCSVTATPMSNSKSWAIELENGRLHFPHTYLRDTNIKTATILCHEKSLDLAECRLMLTPGELHARAHYDSRAGSWSGILELHKASVARLLKDDWQKRLSGELFGKCILNGTNKGLSAAEGHLALRNGLLEGLPFLSELTIDNTRPYRSIELEKADCTLLYPYSAPERNLKKAWLFDKIDIVSRDSALIIRGHVIIADDGALGGSLTIGIPQHIADHLPLPSKRIHRALFNGHGEAGYAWINLNLSGTVNDPKEDLSVRLSTLLSSVLPELSTDSATDMLRRIFAPANSDGPQSSTSQPPHEQPEQPADIIINGAGELLNRGLRSLF